MIYFLRAIFGKENTEGITCLVLTQYEDFLSLNELIGTYTFDSNNRILKIAKGKLVNIDENNLVIWVQKEEKVLNFFSNYFKII